MMATWVDVCDLREIEVEDVIRFDHGGHTYAVYRDEDGVPYCTDGLCTHEQVHLADGLVLEDEIECPKHNGRFNYKTGAALRTPACVALLTYPARLLAGRIQVQL
jgi:3-phenylpropionate/trans-cinnamate dioxygenase ferredoxin subunit